MPHCHCHISIHSAGGSGGGSVSVSVSGGGSSKLTGDMLALKNEIMAEVRAEISKAKDEIIAAMRR
jgi:hypothetical protein